MAIKTVDQCTCDRCGRTVHEEKTKTAGRIPSGWYQLSLASSTGTPMGNRDLCDKCHGVLMTFLTPPEKAASGG